MLCVVAKILRFRNKILARIRNDDNREGDLTVAEIRNAEIDVIKNEQTRIKQDDKFLLLKKSLNLFTGESGLIRLKGRMENSDVDVGSKFPTCTPSLYYLSSSSSQTIDTTSVAGIADLPSYRRFLLPIYRNGFRRATVGQIGLRAFVYSRVRPAVTSIWN